MNVAGESTPVMDAEPVNESRELIRLATSDDGAMSLSRAPETVLQEAGQAATALTNVLRAKTKKVMMNGEQYLECEDWILLGRFYGITAKEDGDPEPVFYPDGTKGFKASAVAVDRAGREISRATAFCLNDEEKWRARPKYEYHIVLKDGTVVSEEHAPADKSLWIWEDAPTQKNPKRRLPKKQKVCVGEEPVPFFQLASMAQTRAAAKVLGFVLRFVPVLAGYRPTPAEELDGKTKEEPNGEQPKAAPAPPPPAEPTRASAKPAAAVDVARRCWCKDASGQHLPAARRVATIARDGKPFDRVYYDCAKSDGDPTRCKSVFYPDPS